MEKNPHTILTTCIHPLSRFLKKEYVFEVSEKAHVGDYLGIVEVESRLGVVFSLNVDSRRIPFAINPSTGTVSLDAPVDYEKSQSYNYTVFASSMVRTSGSGVLGVGCVWEKRRCLFAKRERKFSLILKGDWEDCVSVRHLQEEDLEDDCNGLISYFKKEIMDLLIVYSVQN